MQEIKGNAGESGLVQCLGESLNCELHEISDQKWEAARPTVLESGGQGSHSVHAMGTWTSQFHCFSKEAREGIAPTSAKILGTHCIDTFQVPSVTIQTWASDKGLIRWK